MLIFWLLFNSYGWQITAIQLNEIPNTLSNVAMDGMWEKESTTGVQLEQENPYARVKVSKGAKIKNRYSQVPHLTQDANGKVTNS